ncbi:response regulator [Stenotrophomonas rhizophila]|jgi:CheY-like chemotaxis protein|uniref:response regulator n=1 Tax=Stenotrophomonas rhizophila TaxID=216778 RepID=UPI000456941E|nr:response regulator [Stenotrophomonas rhizophila]AHY59482.1 chemotaxis protein CheY [Stenotrophomonas rhizophila]
MKARVLVVEDESLVAMMVEDCLIELGYEVAAVAPNVDAALAALQGGGIDCAMLDVNLGGTPSFPIAEALEARGIPYMFVTGYDGTAIPPNFRARHGLQKPFRMRELQQAMAGLQDAPAVPGDLIA